LLHLMPINSPDEKKLFVFIYRKYKYLMMKIAYNILNDHFLAEDAVHEAFIKVAHNIKQIRNVESAAKKRYLMIITRNTAIDMYRSRKKQIKHEICFDELNDGYLPFAYIETDIENETLDILKNLPVKYRDVFLLKYSYHMSYAEISKLMSIPEGTVRQRIARGKLIVKEEIHKRKKK